MKTKPSTRELKKALQILWGQDFLASRAGGLKPLDRGSIKKIYRKRVLLLHPDITGDDGFLFREVNRAYSYIDGLLAQEPDTLKEIFPSLPVQSTFPEKKAPYFPTEGKKDLPEYPLRFGQFLYHRGYIDRETLIRSLVWQGQNRPLYGELAQEYDYLDTLEVNQVLRQRLRGEKFGETALRLGFLNKLQHLALLGYQRGYQAQVGQFFIVNRLLTKDLLQWELQAHRQHNRKFPQNPI